MGRGIEERTATLIFFKRNVKAAIVSANNQYAGFRPGTVKIFQEMMELPELSWGDKKDINQFDDTGYGKEKRIRQKQKQTSISDFLS